MKNAKIAMNSKNAAKFVSCIALSALGTNAVAQPSARLCDPVNMREMLVHQFKDCPGNTLTLKIGYNPGGNTYALGSHFMAYLKSITGNANVNVVLEAKPGASGEIASRIVADSDASTAACSILVAQSNQLTTNMMGFPNAVDPLKDLVPIAPLGESPLVLAVNSETTPYRTLEEFITHLKTHRGAGRKDFFGSNGNYATDHVATEILLQQIGTFGTHVPFTGSAPLIQNLLATTEGQVNFALLSLGLIKPHLISGKFQALGIAAPEDLVLQRPDGSELVIPSISTLVPNFKDATIWVALAGGRRMPGSLGRTMSEVASCFAEDSNVRAVLVDQMAFKLGGTRTQLLRRMKVEAESAKQVPAR